MSSEARDGREKRVLNVMQVVALNTVLTVLFCAGLAVAGVGWLAAALWGWIGGAVLTLWCSVLIVLHAERRNRLRADQHAATLRAWEEDALDDAWEAAEQVAQERRALAEEHRSSGTNG